jgi:hypothetical protein
MVRTARAGNTEEELTVRPVVVGLSVIFARFFIAHRAKIDYRQHEELTH